MKILIIISLLTFFSCSKKEATSTPVQVLDGKLEMGKTQSSPDSESKEKYNFDEKEDESCETEEELEEKMAKPKQEAFKLQGGDPGCEAK